MENKWKIGEYFAEVETTKKHKGYFCSIGEALCIVILGLFCGLRNVKQISQWSNNPSTKDSLCNYFGIQRIPCYYWILCLIKLIKPKSLNQCFINWVNSLLSGKANETTVSFDGKTVSSTVKMKNYDNPLHIVSAHIAELGITFSKDV